VGSERDVTYSWAEQTPAERQPVAYPAYPGVARAPRPPLTKRMRTAHWIVLDCAVAGFFTLSVLIAALRTLRPYSGHAVLPLVLLFGVALFFPMALRRKAPTLAFAALLVLGVLASFTSGYKLVTVILLAAAYVLYTVTVSSSKRTGATALGLLLAVMIAIASVSNPIRPRASAGDLVPVALANVLAWVTGYSTRQRRLYAVTLQDQAASSAVAQERLRIARELHDVVAHSMSVIAVQAGYGQYVIDNSPDGAREALGAIQATSRDALDEMRRMLGVLRQQDAEAAGAQPGTKAGNGSPAADGSQRRPGAAPPPPDLLRPPQAPLSPAPGLADLDRLIQRTKGAGVRVALEVAGRARPAPPGVDLSAYRIIQEALTNVVKHAGTNATATVRVSYSDWALNVEVADDGGGFAGHRQDGAGTVGLGTGGGLPCAPPLPGLAGRRAEPFAGGGHGIIGMRERVHLCGGTFSAGPCAAGGFRVTATLPLAAADALSGRGRTGINAVGHDAILSPANVAGGPA
jgi:signal transduction histidine kinase